jgi:oligopeptide transport system permease protein
MGRYVARRILQMVPVLIGTTFLIFAMVWALPGDPFAGRCGQRPCPPSFVQAETQRLHLDKPLPVQYAYYMAGLAKGDIGTKPTGSSVASEADSAPTPGGSCVAPYAPRAYPITAKLTTVAIIFEIILGIGAGIVSGLRHGGWFDNVSLVVTLVAISLPVFVIGFVLQYILGVRLGIFPVTVRPGAPWGDLILPGFVLASLSLAFVTRLMRASLMEVLKADHVRTAIAKGLPRALVIRRHVVRNSLIPVITYIGTDVGFLLAGAIITEGVFNIAGVGGLTFQAVRVRDNPLVVGITTILVLVVLVVNLLVDLLYAVLDPRIRYD